MTSYLVDTNILLRMCDRSSAEHLICTQAVQRIILAADECRSCAQTLIEFWAVATRPREVNGLGLSMDEALANLQDFKNSMPCLPEPPNILDRWQSLVSQNEVKGRKSHDARLAALALECAIPNILTLNGPDFARFAPLKVVSPLDIK